MPDNPKEPRAFDAVLGGQSPPVNAAVLGGLAGVKRRLASTSNEVRIAALSDALKYGQAGLDIVVDIFKTETGAVAYAAWNLLCNTTNKTASQELLKNLSTFTFDVITVNDRGEEIRRIPSSASFFTEDLGDGIFMEMVSIPGGTFLMGSPATEKGRYETESPLHQVTVQPFFIGKYVVTQAQWKAVAALPEINSSLNLDPSNFKGANRPVESVSQHDAMEFCARLAKKTGKIYRLPSEAQWEYACRAGTTTPFHFGEKITTNLANYNRYRHQTTDVGSFPPNAFGLYDMHGNVWEWCADAYHKNYNGAPSDGSVWEFGENTSYRRLRGGSWFVNPENCRSAIRYYVVAGLSIDDDGFRVVCAAGWTL